jgi:DNA-binding NarL/FixJ family response regulator
MLVAIADPSPAYSMRLGSLVAETKGIQTILQIFDPDAVVEIIRNNNPDVVLFDMNMGGSKGMNLLKQLIEQLPIGLIIVLVDHEVSYYRRKCKEIGIVHCLDKTFDFNLVPSLIKEHNEKKDTGCN